MPLIFLPSIFLPSIRVHPYYYPSKSPHPAQILCRWHSPFFCLQVFPSPFPPFPPFPPVKIRVHWCPFVVLVSFGAQTFRHLPMRQCHLDRPLANLCVTVFLVKRHRRF